MSTDTTRLEWEPTGADAIVDPEPEERATDRPVGASSPYSFITRLICSASSPENRTLVLTVSSPSCNTSEISCSLFSKSPSSLARRAARSTSD